MNPDKYSHPYFMPDTPEMQALIFTGPPILLFIGLVLFYLYHSIKSKHRKRK